MTPEPQSENQLLAGFLPLLAAHNQQAQGLILGPGDDCAILDLRDGLTALTTDTQTENQDFRRTWPSGRTTGGYQVGWKAVTQNLADLAAMGASPRTLLISLTLTPDTDPSWAQDLAQGAIDSCQAQGAGHCSISGGDLGLGSEISITVTAVGQVHHPVLRSGARPGDALILAGQLGTAAAGLALLDSPLLADPTAQPLSPSEEACIAAQQTPTSPLTSGLQAPQALHAMLDISDGLLRDAERIAQASGLTISIDPDLLTPHLEPLRDAATRLTTTPQEAHHQALHWALTGGENHGLLATSPPHAIPPGFTRIGTVHTGPAHVTLNGTPYQAKGWDHFDRTTR